MRKKRAQQFLFLEAESLTFSLFYRYYFGRCSSELAQLVPLPFSWRKSTCYYDRLLDFSVTIPRCYKDIYSNSFFPHTAKLWNSLPIQCFSLTQAWRGRKKQARGHHSPPSIQREWLTIDDRKNSILASLCLASYLATNWLQKLETKYCLSCRSYFCSYVCVCGISVWFIYNETKLPFCKMSVFVLYT